MSIEQAISAFFVPAAVIAAFVLHWLTIRPAATAAERLPLCRGAYLVLLLLAWARAAEARGSPSLLLALGMSASFAGDFFNLQFPGASRRLKEPLAFGIASFMVAQAFYIAAFLSILPLGELVARGNLVPALAVLVLVPAFLFRLRVYSPDRPRSVMLLAFAYGFILGAMAAIALSAALARGGPWILVACGAISFLGSDAVMGTTTIRGVHPKSEFQVPWISYLLAQGLIIAGFALAARGGA
jgi:uncharacterized membrane protein YhhN